MKKTAALALLAIMGLGGCAAIPQQQTWTVAPPANQPTRSNQAPATLVEHVQERWMGEDVPDAQWIEATALISCKHLIGSEEPPAATEGIYADRNNELIVAAAGKLMCNEAMPR